MVSLLIDHDLLHAAQMRFLDGFENSMNTHTAGGSIRAKQTAGSLAGDNGAREAQE